MSYELPDQSYTFFNAKTLLICNASTAKRPGIFLKEKILLEFRIYFIKFPSASTSIIS